MEAGAKCAIDASSHGVSVACDTNADRVINPCFLILGVTNFFGKAGYCLRSSLVRRGDHPPQRSDLPPNCCFVQRIGLGVWSPDEICCEEGADLELKSCNRVFKIFLHFRSSDHSRHSRPSKVTGDSSIPDEQSPPVTVKHSWRPQLSEQGIAAFHSLKGWKLIRRKVNDNRESLCPR